jgi:hypothetical protein
MTASLNDGILTIRGSVPAPVDARVEEDHQANIIRVTENGGGQQVFSSVGVTAINAGFVRSFLYQTTGNFTDAKTLRVNQIAPGGRAIFDLLGIFGSFDNRVEADVTIDIRSSLGSQTAAVLLNEVESATVRVTANLGLGNDELVGFLFGDLKGSADVDFDLNDAPDKLIRGGQVRIPGGDDRFTITSNLEGFQGEADIGANARLNVRMRGVDGGDTLQMDYKGEVDGLLRLRLNGQNGADNVIADLQLKDDGQQDGIRGLVNAVVRGGADVEDLVLLLIEDESGGGVTIDRADELED